MAGPIRFFVNVRKFFHKLGIDSSQMNSKWGLNWKNLLFLYSQIQIFVLTIAFCLYDAKTMFDYGCCAYISISELACFFYYSLQLLEIAYILEWIKKVDGLIGKSM